MDTTPQTNLFGQYQPTAIKGEQLPLFHEPVQIQRPDNRDATDKRLARKFDERDTPMLPLSQAKRKRTLRERVEQQIRERGLPYVNVNECKKQLFAAAKLQSFHFVVYSPEGDNWLLSCARTSRASRADMAQWEQVFGEGYKAVFAAERAGGIIYRNLAGERIELPSRE